LTRIAVGFDVKKDPAILPAYESDQPHPALMNLPAPFHPCVLPTAACPSSKGTVMISRVLSDAANKIRDYLSDPANRDVYIGTTRWEIEALVAEMDRVRRKLETPPP
jgi:hypothetical protein